MNNQRFWGIAAIVIGTVALMGKVGNLSPWLIHNLAMYWPLLLILVGALLLFKVLKPIVIIMTVGALVLVVLNPYQSIWYGLGTGESSSTKMVRSSVEGVQALDVEFVLGAGSITTSGSDRGLYEVVTSGVGLRAPAHTYDLRDGVGHLRLKQGDNLSISGQARWDAHFSQLIPLRLKIEGGAGQLDLDFRTVRLEDLKISAGAGKIAVLVGAALPVVNIDMAAAAADIDLLLPAGARVELVTASPLLKMRLPNQDQWVRQGNKQVYQGAAGTPVIKVKIGSAAARVNVRFA